MKIDSKTRLLCIIGDPVSHSLSPFIQNMFIEDTKEPYSYMAFNVQKDKVKYFLEVAKFMNIKGFNITMPLKEEMYKAVDRVDDDFKRLGAVNTVSLIDGEYVGYNTDGIGFIRSLPASHKANSDTHIVMYGGGGAAKAVGAAAYDEGAKITLLVRDVDKTKESLGEIESMFTVLPFDTDVLELNPSILVNATPLGLHGHSKDFTDLTFMADLDKDTLVYDLNYSPLYSTFLKEAEKVNLKIQNGIGHLVEQAAYSFDYFTGVRPSDSSIENVMKEIKKQF